MQRAPFASYLMGGHEGELGLDKPDNLRIEFPWVGHNSNMAAVHLGPMRNLHDHFP